MTYVPTKPISLAQLAEQCGVAKSTVSRVLNRDDSFSIRPELRDHILTIARKMNYRPTLAARSLRVRKTHLIAIMGTTNMPHPSGLIARTLREVVETLHQEGYDAFATFPHPQRGHELPPWQIDGAVLLAATQDHAWYELERMPLPYVALNGLCGPTGSVVEFDEAGGAKLALEHLLALGHRRIAYIRRTGTQEHPSVQPRLHAYRSIMQIHGVEPLPGDAQEWSDLTDALRHAIGLHQATAILTYDHLTAIDLLAQGRKVGVRFPQHCSMVCFNDEFPVAAVTPQLTAVGVNVPQASQATARLLLERVADVKAPRRVERIAYHLVTRDSTGPASQTVTPTITPA